MQALREPSLFEGYKVWHWSPKRSVQKLECPSKTSVWTLALPQKGLRCANNNKSIEIYQMPSAATSVVDSSYRTANDIFLVFRRASGAQASKGNLVTNIGGLTAHTERREGLSES